MSFRRKWSRRGGGPKDNRRFGGKPTASALRKELPAPKELSRPRFWFVSVPLIPEAYEQDYWPAVKECIIDGVVWPSYSHVPLEPRRLVFLVWKKGDLWQPPVMWMRSSIKKGTLHWKLFGAPFPWSQRKIRS